jgi:tetratricopeptide (TPR) repeat protein
VPARLGVADCLAELGSFEESVAEHRRLAAEIEDRFGGEHPRLSVVYNNLGEALSQWGRFDEAEDALARSMAVRELTGATATIGYAESVARRGLLAERRGEYAEAEEFLRDSLALLSPTFGLDHAQAMEARVALARVLSRQHRTDEARGVIEEVLAETRTRSDRRAHRGKALSLGCWLEIEGRNPARAQTLCGEAIGLLETNGDIRWLQAAQARGAAAAALLGELEEARALAQSALTSSRGAPEHEALAHWVLAASGAAQDLDADAHLIAAREALERAHPGNRAELDRLSFWRSVRGWP